MTGPANSGGPRSNRISFALVAVVLIAIVVYVLATGGTRNPILFVGAAVVIAIIGVFVYFKRAK